MTNETPDSADPALPMTAAQFAEWMKTLATEATEATETPDVAPGAATLAIAPGKPVRIHRAWAGRHNYADARGYRGVVQHLTPGHPFPFARVAFDRGRYIPMLLMDVPVPHLEPWPEPAQGGDAPAAKPKRRSPLNLRPPADTRTERERQTEGVTWLRALGYAVIETDTHRGKAVCGRCSREQKRRVFVHCAACGAPGFSPTTGADAGLADTEVQDARRWPGTPCVSLCVEWKRSSREVPRPEQAARVARGETVIVWNRGTLAAAVAAFERSIGVEPLAEVLAAAGEGATK